MQELVIFYQSHGLVLTIIAIIGVTILGALKYGNIFHEIEEKVRHILYIGISIALSIIGGLIYLLTSHTFTWATFALFSGGIFAVNQGFYAIFKNMTLQDVVKKLIEDIAKHFKK